MKKRAKKREGDPLFTIKGLVIGAILFSLYAVILFSLDPEWVMWAGPMALGALYVPNQPPPLFTRPETVFQMASLFSLLNLAVLFLVAMLRGEAPLAWPRWLKTWLKEQFGIRAGSSAQDVDVPLEPTVYNRQHPATTGGTPATLPHCRRAVSGDLGGGNPEDRRFL